MSVTVADLSRFVAEEVVIELFARSVGVRCLAIGRGQTIHLAAVDLSLQYTRLALCVVGM
jgi:hypothetical protein